MSKTPFFSFAWIRVIMFCSFYSGSKLHLKTSRFYSWRALFWFYFKSKSLLYFERFCPYSNFQTWVTRRAAAQKKSVKSRIRKNVHSCCLSREPISFPSGSNRLGDPFYKSLDYLKCWALCGRYKKECTNIDHSLS